MVRNTLETLNRRSHDIAFSALFGAFLGGINYLTSTMMKAHFIDKYGTQLTPAQIRLLAANLGSGFILQGAAVGGGQGIFSMWVAGIRNPQREQEDLVDVFRDVVASGAFNAGSIVGALSNLSRSASIAVLVGFNTFTTLAQELN